jgi:hypothetical protein
MQLQDYHDHHLHAVDEEKLSSMFRQGPEATYNKQ